MCKIGFKLYDIDFIWCHKAAKWHCATWIWAKNTISTTELAIWHVFLVSNYRTLSLLLLPKEHLHNLEKSYWCHKKKNPQHHNKFMSGNFCTLNFKISTLCWYHMKRLTVQFRWHCNAMHCQNLQCMSDYCGNISR